MGFLVDPFISQLGTIYLIHFDRAYINCLHYLGWSEPFRLKERIRRHRNDQGSEILTLVNKAGIGWRVVGLWENKTLSDETKMKKSNQLRRFCPVCSPVRIKLKGVPG